MRHAKLERNKKMKNKEIASVTTIEGEYETIGHLVQEIIERATLDTLKEFGIKNVDIQIKDKSVLFMRWIRIAIDNNEMHPIKSA